MIKQITELAYSILIMAGVLFAFFAVFGFLDGLIEAFF